MHCPVGGADGTLHQSTIDGITLCANEPFTDEELAALREYFRLIRAKKIKGGRGHPPPASTGNNPHQKPHGLPAGNSPGPPPPTTTMSNPSHIDPLNPPKTLYLKYQAIANLNFQPRYCPPPLECIASRHHNTITLNFNTNRDDHHITGPNWHYQCQPHPTTTTIVIAHLTTKQQSPTPKPRRR